MPSLNMYGFLYSGVDSTRDLDETKLTRIAYYKEVCSHTYYENDGISRQVCLEGHINQIQIKKEENNLPVEMLKLSHLALKTLNLIVFDIKTETITGIQYDI